MNTKIYTIIKTAYSAWVYGNTGEYFTCIYTKEYEYKGEKFLQFDYFYFKGMYGPEERIKEEMEKKGYVKSYTWGNYGKVSKKDLYKNTMSETEAINYIKNDFKNN